MISLNLMFQFIPKFGYELLHTSNKKFNLGYQFTVQSTYTDEHLTGYQPQVVSWTKLIVEPTSRDFQVLCDRSYASIGFLVHGGKYITRCIG
jgi:hypothetical protein